MTAASTPGGQASDPRAPGASEAGTQAERTVLAWTRTSLSLFAGVVAVARLAARTSLALAIAVAAIGLPLTALALWSVNRRYHGPQRARDGTLPLLATALAVLLAAAGLTEVLVS